MQFETATKKIFFNFWCIKFNRIQPHYWARWLMSVEKDSILDKWYLAPASLFCLYEQISYCGDFNNLLKTNANFYLIPFHNLPLLPKLCGIILLMKGIVFRKARIFCISIWATKLGSWNIISIFHICFPHKSKRNIIQLKHDPSLNSQCFPFPHSLTSSISSEPQRCKETWL